MAELTLESLAKRVEDLERQVASQAKPAPRNDWLEVAGMFRDSDYHYQVIAEGRAIREAERELARQGIFPDMDEQDGGLSMANDVEVTFNTIRTLDEATVQEIQLELIRRSSFNLFDGPRVIATLMRHRPMWTSVIMDRFGCSGPDKPGGLVYDSLIKLRDLRGNRWNVDTLYILTPDVPTAKLLRDAIEQEGWNQDELDVHENPEEIARSIGVYGGSNPPGVISVWWD